eukprot:TRINITY_DN9967_c0_g1_i1.p1 TRINITY_DN9967_c0_g1~~TRINITY_DN9967_c0_g1_i1.p1  ORF type:complete len:697 (+),score=138.36 TRINITY_DN9967_c0_g1_i1:45-2135(+)
MNTPDTPSTGSHDTKVDFTPREALTRPPAAGRNSVCSCRHADNVEKEIADTQRTAFVDAAAMKERVRQNLSRPKYNVSDFYHQTGLFQAVARDLTFEKVTLSVIAFNALWIAFDTDNNSADLLLEAHLVFQVAENGFCAFFSFEWLVRYMSFRRKQDGLRDPWFVFDGLMVALMVGETWIFSIFVLLVKGEASGLGKGSILRVAKLMRLSRMCRMARLLRCTPELMIMIKGLLAAARSVFFTLVLLGALLFVFAIVFTQMTVDTALKELYFRNVGASMYFLVVYGTLLLSTDFKADELSHEGGFLITCCFFLFILFGAVLLMNMLIGVLCEVVTAVAITEKEEMLVTYVRTKLEKVMAIIDEDGGGTISRDEFMLILDNLEAMEALQDVGVDVVGLVDFADFIFADDSLADGDDSPEVELTLPEFMNVILQLRGSNNATVKDIVDLRKFVHMSVVQSSRNLDVMTSKMDNLVVKVRRIRELLEEETAEKLANRARQILVAQGKATINSECATESAMATQPKATDSTEPTKQTSKVETPPTEEKPSLRILMRGDWNSTETPELKLWFPPQEATATTTASIDNEHDNQLDEGASTDGLPEAPFLPPTPASLVGLAGASALQGRSADAKPGMFLQWDIENSSRSSDAAGNGPLGPGVFAAVQDTRVHDQRLPLKAKVHECFETNAPQITISTTSSRHTS